MSKEIYISSTPHETRLAIVENDDLTEIYYERENEYTLAGSIYNGKVTRVLPGMQSSFVDVGLERDAFLYITDFMEEAGDSAEFDHSDSASGSRRGPREDRGATSGDRTPREENAGGRDELAGDPSRLAAPATQEARGGSRGDREGGRRRRGGRDNRGPNRENRGVSEDRDAAGDRDALIAMPPPVEARPEASTPVHSGYIDPDIDTSAADLGEGAPGADGSRRWRGRRGRRRGRSTVQREESQVLQQPGADRPVDASSETPSGRGYQADSAHAEEPEEDLSQEYDDSVGRRGSRFDLDASAAAPTSTSEPSGADAQSSAEPSSGSDDRRPRERGEHDSRDRNRRDRSGRDREDRGPRAPRGFAPSRALYGVDAADEAGQNAGEPTPEPLILPGESLSKYRKSEDAGAQTGATGLSQTPLPPPPPSTEYTLQGAWDGSGALPGETIRPRSGWGSPDRSGPGRSNEGRDQRDRHDDRNSRGDRHRREDRNRSSSQSAPAGAVRFRNEPAPSIAPPSGTPPAHSGSPVDLSAAAEPTVYAQPTPPPAAPELSYHTPEQPAPVSPVTEAHHEPAEYEPTEASASVRFDPASRSEFRQGAPVAEPSEAPLDEVVTHDTEPEAQLFHDRPAQTVPAEQAPAAAGLTSSQPPEEQTSLEPADLYSIAHTITPQPDVPMASIHSTSSEAAAASGHEFTSVQNTGDMLSEAHLPPQQEIAEPASPLHHERAILDAPAQLEGAGESPSNLHVEEFTEEEEDFSASTLHASAIEEMDYEEEEESLEGAADLGTMIREMSIDQITRVGEGPEEDEDILEEEYAVDDHIAGSPEDEDDDEEQEPRSFDESSHQEEHDRGLSTASCEQGYPVAERFASDAPPAGGRDRESDSRSSRREPGRRDGRRDGRGRDRGGDRARSTGGSGDRSTSRPGRRDGRHSAQTTNLPAISDLLKPGQEVLVQIAKEPIAKKGARITSHIALPGRFLVFMPTVNHTGVSRKIESDGERRRLKEILLSEKGEASGGFIVRTAAANASEEELRSDLRFLLNLWADIKQRSESSKSPALIYHDLNLVERILRDQVTDTFSAIWVDTETEYERVLRFLQRFQPSLIRRVKLYTKETPLFEQFGITEEINKALRSKVWLKSGGSIVINQTEALVAIDINTGKYVGKTARLEDTIVKTNLDAIPEIVRQIRLRDLGGIIIIDFIDMDERKNRHKVMTALEEELKKDRAPSKVLQFNDFGLVAITRKRVKQSLERTLSATCNVCQGTGMTKSPVTVCNDIYIEMRKMQKHLDRGDVMLRVNPEVVKQLKAPGTKWLQEMEEMVGKTILVKSDPSLHPEQFDIH